MPIKPAQQSKFNKVTFIPSSLPVKGAIPEKSVLPVTPTKAPEKQKQRNKITYVPGRLPVEGVVRLPSVLGVLGISKTSFLDGVRVGKYPAGKLLSPRCRVWSVIEIRALLASLEAEAV